METLVLSLLNSCKIAAETADDSSVYILTRMHSGTSFDIVKVKIDPGNLIKDFTFN